MAQHVRKGEELNEESLKVFLQQNELINDPKSDLEVTQYSNGFSNLTYLLAIEDKEYVLRRPPFGAIKRGHDMGREYKVLSRLYKAFAKSPQAYAYTEDEAWIGSSFYVMEKVDGIILSPKEVKQRTITPEEFPVIANTWLETFVELHRVDYKSVGLEDLGRPDGYVNRQVSNWGKQWVKAATRDVEEAQKLIQWMDDHQPRTYDHSLIHNDYRYDNIVFKDDSWKEVRAVLDWEMCTLGDPLMDLGSSLAYWTMPSDGPLVANGIPSPTILPGNPGRTEVVQMYCAKSGRSSHDLVFYYVYGLFKLAVIAQQIYYRYNKGLTTDERFANLDQSAQFLCMIAWQAVQKKRIDHLF